MTGLNKAIAIAEQAAEQLQKSHVSATTYTNQKGTVVNRAEHEDKRQKKSAPPQADSNRHKWGELDDDEHPRDAMRRIGSKELGQIALGKNDAQAHAKRELAARGVDEHGKWLGFDKAEKHHGVSTKDMNNPDDDEIVGHFQTVHHKVLGAIASGHLDPKRLASEELANRGHDHAGKWVGFNKAAELHDTKKDTATPKKRPRLVPNPDVQKEVDGNMTIIGHQDKSHMTFSTEGRKK